MDTEEKEEVPVIGMCMYMYYTCVSWCISVSKYMYVSVFVCVSA